MDIMFRQHRGVILPLKFQGSPRPTPSPNLTKLGAHPVPLATDWHLTLNTLRRSSAADLSQMFRHVQEARARAEFTRVYCSRARKESGGTCKVLQAGLENRGSSEERTEKDASRPH